MKLTKAQIQAYDLEKTIGGSVGNTCGIMLVNEPQEAEVLKRAVNILFEKNDTLRTKLFVKNGVVSQCVQPYAPIKVEVLTFENKEQVHEYSNAFARVPLDINNKLVEIKGFHSKDFCGLLFKLHHIISDGWTASVLSTQFYKFLQGEDFKAYSYSEYVESEKKYLESNRHSNDIEYFTSLFKEKGEIVLFDETEAISKEAKRKTYILDKKIADRIKEFANEYGLSPYSVFLTAISLVYSRLKNNAENFYIGTIVLNRTNIAERNTVGMFVNTIPFLVDLKYDESFIKNADKTTEDVFSIFRHQKCNYVDVLNEFRDAKATNKWFDITFSFQASAIKGENFESEWYCNGMQAETLQIHVDDYDCNGVFRLHYDYQIEKFTEADIEKLHSQLMTLLFDGIENPNKNISNLEMISPAEKQKALNCFNDTKHTYNIPEHSTIYSLFEAQAENNKDKVCITANGENATYGKLLNIAESLDSEIRKLTGNEKSIIAVIAERSIEMYSAIYGIIRGGNAYLPIDPNYPQDRIDYILENSKAKAVIAQGKFTSLAGKTKCIDMTDFITNTPANEKLPCNAEENDTAYVIYTSGSTGNPKGAKISHKSVINRILWMHDKYPLCENDVILQKTPYTFDVSVWELFWWGMVGASLTASKPDEHFLPAKILEETKKNKVTHLHFVPSVFDIFLTYLENNPDEKHKFNTVKYVFLSGEALTANSISRFYKMFDYEKVTLHNLYGPTECAVDVSYYDCVPTDIDPVPIGKPIYNTQLYVVDKYLNPVPIGVKGELCIGGVNVGQGYLNNEQLTNEKFIDNPFHEGKIYKTGDLAYFREDGEIIFCGRIDHQIKLNGQRIELGEIENIISNIDGVEAVAVMVRNSNNKDILVAFYSGEKIGEAVIKNACENTLPAYMVPSVITHIEKMPLNQSGKLDRKALATIEIVETENDIYEAPINDTEAFICNIFKSVLKVERVGRNSNFFDLGGTSLSMIELLSQNEFENISAADFIANPTPAKLSMLIDSDSQIETEYLELLHSAHKSKKAFVVFPYAGGGAEAYAKFVDSLKNASNDISVYFIRYLHSADECRKAAEEIERVLKGQKIYFYSHCVGAAVAMQILNILELNKICSVEHYIVGGFIPANKPSKRNIWNITPDFMLRSILTKAGAPFDKLYKDEVKVILKNFRCDTDFSAQYFYQKPNKICCPLSLVVSKRDFFTTNYKDAKPLWKNYCKNFKNLLFINSSTHYFQADNSDDLINNILNEII